MVLLSQPSLKIIFSNGQFKSTSSKNIFRFSQIYKRTRKNILLPTSLKYFDQVSAYVVASHATSSTTTAHNHLPSKYKKSITKF